MTDDRLKEIENLGEYPNSLGRALKKELLTEIYRLRGELAQRDEVLKGFRDAIDEACNMEGYDDLDRMWEVKDHSRRYWNWNKNNPV
jgi:hypothetical protein